MRTKAKSSINKIVTSGTSTVEKNVKASLTTIPLFKNNQFDYYNLIKWSGINRKYTWIIFIPIVIFIITAVSNGANLTDGIDGLAAGSSAIIVFVLAIFSFVSGNINLLLFKYHVHTEHR